MVPEMKALTNGETSRTYIYVTGDKREELTFENVVALGVSERGTHRLEFANGDKVIVPTGFKAIKVVADKWSI